MFNVFSVSAASATRWAMGEIPDMGLERGPLEVVYLNELVGRDDYPAMLREVVRLTDAGCRAGIAHVVNPSILSRYLRYGSVPTFREVITWQGVTCLAARIVCPPEQWARWISRIKRIAGQAAFPAKTGCQDSGGGHQNAP